MSNARKFVIHWTVPARKEFLQSKSKTSFEIFLKHSTVSRSGVAYLAQSIKYDGPTTRLQYHQIQASVLNVLVIQIEDQRTRGCESKLFRIRAKAKMLKITLMKKRCHNKYHRYATLEKNRNYNQSFLWQRFDTVKRNSIRDVYICTQ